MVMGTIPIDGLQWFPWMEGEVECTDCHMPPMGIREAPYDIPSHTWYFISPEKSVQFDMPNSCTVSCHHAGSEEGLMSDEKALEWIDLWKANSRDLMQSAIGNLSIAGEMVGEAGALGFDEVVVADANDSYQEALWVLRFVQADASMVHNPDFYSLLLTHSHDEAVALQQSLMPGRVRGLITNADGKAVSGAEVRTDDKVWWTTTADGSFDFAIAPGEHRFDVYSGSKKEATFSVTVTDGETSDAGTMKFKKDEDSPGFGIIIVLSLVIVAIVMSRSKKNMSKRTGE
jgi:hypothetical protein